MTQRKGIILAGGSSTHDSLPDAASFICTLQKRQGLQVCAAPKRLPLPRSGLTQSRFKS
jgi:hypothetical protein